MDRVRSFVNECTDIYKKYSDKQEGKTTAVKDKMHIKISDFRTFMAPILNRMSGNPYVTVDDLREFHIKAGQLKDNNPTKTRVQAIDAPDFSLVSITSGDFIGRVRPTKHAKRASKLPGFEIEVAYAYLPQDEPRHLLLGDLTNSVEFTKAKFIFHAGVPNIGKWLFAAARWIDPKDSSRNSPWSPILNVLVA
jgi:hypothetical protein